MNGLATGGVLAPLVLIALLASGGGCTDVADARAQRDARIGQASAPGISLRVHDGLARATGLTPPGLYLWLQAPDVSLDVDDRRRRARRSRSSPTTSSPTPRWSRRAPVAGVTVEPITAVAWRRPRGAGLSRRLRGGGTLTLRIAPPTADTAGPWRFAVFADVQEAIDRVQDIYRRMSQDAGIRFAVMTGRSDRNGATPSSWPASRTEMTRPGVSDLRDAGQSRARRARRSVSRLLRPRQLQLRLPRTSSSRCSTRPAPRWPPLVYDWLAAG